MLYVAQQQTKHLRYMVKDGDFDLKEAAVGSNTFAYAQLDEWLQVSYKLLVTDLFCKCQLIIISFCTFFKLVIQHNLWTWSK